MRGAAKREAAAFTCATMRPGTASFTARAAGISRAAAGAPAARNQGSTAMQCPPTPAPGERISTRGWRFASAIASRTSTPSCAAMAASSLAKAMLTSRKAFSASFTNSATRAVVGSSAARTTSR